MSKNGISEFAAAAALVLSGTSAHGQEARPSPRVSVAIIDISADKILQDDPAVRVIQLNPTPPEGHIFAKKQYDKGDHGDYVASAFVSEFRKMDKSTQVDMYSINPFLQKNTRMMFSRKIISDAIPTLKAKGVKVVITSFGIANKEAGDAIVNEFNKAGMVVFAAIPNSVDDEGIYPAANRQTISIGDENGTRAPLARRKDWAEWVNFSMNGEMEGVHGGPSGASFAVAKAAAYGAKLAMSNPDITVDAMREGMAEHSQSPIYGAVRRIGAPEMISSFARFIPVVTASRDAPVTPVPAEVSAAPVAQPSPAVRAAMMAKRAGMGF